MKKPCAGQRISATIGKIPSGGERTGLLQNGSTDQNSSTEALKNSRTLECATRNSARDFCFFFGFSSSGVLEFWHPYFSTASNTPDQSLRRGSTKRFWHRSRNTSQALSIGRSFSAASKSAIALSKSCAKYFCNATSY